MHRSAAIALLPDPSTIPDPTATGKGPSAPRGESSAVLARPADGTATIAGGSGGGVESGPNSSSGGTGAAAATAAGSSAGAGTAGGTNGGGREHAQDSMLAHLLRHFHPEFIGALLSFVYE